MEPKSHASDLTAVPLTWTLCKRLAGNLRESERIECMASGHQPEQALAAALFDKGWSRAVVAEEGPKAIPVGAFGYTSNGTIWSLWGSLSRKQSVRILKESKEWTAGMVRRSGRLLLHNVVHSKNTSAIAWINATGAFWMDTTNPRRMPNGDDGFYFETLPVRRAR